MRLGAAAAALLALCCALAGCTVPPNPAYDAKRPHHRPAGFQNNDIDFKPKNFFVDVMLRWRLPSLLKGLPPAPDAAPPTVAPDLALLRANTGPQAKPTATWIGHATVLLQLPTAGGTLNLLTDPQFSERASPFSFAGPKRFQPPGVALTELPRIDIVVVSHNHYDHLDEASVRALAAQPGGSPLFLVPLGLKGWLAERGIANAIELDWWDAVAFPAGGTPPRAVDAMIERAVGPDRVAPPGRVQVVLTPVQHWSGRGLNDQLHTLWGGWAVLAPSQRVFFAGDTGYSRDFAEVHKRLAPPEGHAFDLALIPIGAYEPRWFMREQHVDPAESVRIHRDLGARRSLGIHWGTFELTDEALDRPPIDLAIARQAGGLAEDDFFTLAIGQTRVLPTRPPSP